MESARPLQPQSSKICVIAAAVSLVFASLAHAFIPSTPTSPLYPLPSLPHTHSRRFRPVALPHSQVPSTHTAPSRPAEEVHPIEVEAWGSEPDQIDDMDDEFREILDRTEAAERQLPEAEDKYANEAYDELIERVAATPDHELEVVASANFQYLWREDWYLRVCEYTRLFERDKKEAFVRKANKVWSLVSAMLAEALEPEDNVKQVVSAILKETLVGLGEFPPLPLDPPADRRLRSYVQRNVGRMNEPFIEILVKWITRAATHNTEGDERKVQLLQRVLRQWAAEATMETVDKLVSADPYGLPATSGVSRVIRWLTDRDLVDRRRGAEGVEESSVLDGVKADEVERALQVLQSNLTLRYRLGSVAQKVHSEYVRELMGAVRQTVGEATGIQETAA